MAPEIFSPQGLKTRDSELQNTFFVVPVTQCFKCFRYGHIKIFCKSEGKFYICEEKEHGECDKEENVGIVEKIIDQLTKDILNGQDEEVEEVDEIRYNRFEKPDQWLKLPTVTKGRMSSEKKKKLSINEKNLRKMNVASTFTGIIKNEWNEIMNFENKGLETIIAGDFNAHNTLWNCQNTDSNGEILFEIKNNKGFLCGNQNTLSRMGNIGQSSSNIDLIFGHQK
ncbi:hypothetical protein PV326_008350 [Microctonus aethiopoides]|nr:hypothetical protein PV326_008350 [Microctonus aethiopoides]